MLNKLLFLTIALFNLNLFAQSVIEKVNNLNLPKYEDDVLCYYSNGFEAEAEQILKLLNNATNYFEYTFSVKETFAIAVLNESNWKEITNIPYGLPFVSGPPYIVCIPGDLKNELGILVNSALSMSNLNEKYKSTDEELAKQFISLIGFHELGHIYSKACGIDFPNKWTFEFAATYFAYLYLEKTAPLKNSLWLDVGNLLLRNINPQHTSLKDFEKLYVRVGVENYAWYQVVLLKRVAETASELKEKFVKQLREASLSNDNYSLNDLEQINEGFLEWSYSHKLISK